MSFIVGFFQFWYDFVVGDAWEVAAGIVIVLGIGALIVRGHLLATSLVPPIIGVGIVLVVAISIATEYRRRLAA